jgi:hypothetical protein
MAWVYIKEGVVADFVRAEPSKVFLAEYAAKFIEAPDDVDNGWTFDGTTFSPPAQPSHEELTTQKAAAVRAERDRLLAATDWTQAADVPQATKDKWAPYRQALRDVTQQAEFPENIQWPKLPT